VAIEVARRLGVALYGVGLPGHFVVRDATREVYADPFGAGVLLDRAGLEAMWQRRTGAGGLQPAMLAPVAPRSIVLRILNNLRASLGADPDPIRGATLARLRAGFPELADEHDEHRRLMRHFN
jgi:regulator of sirC expression with transglutaminase-like and TPR domain